MVYTTTGIVGEKMRKVKFICSKCGSDKLQGMAWIWINSGKVEDEIESREGYWCDSCQDHVSIHQKENDEESK